jgi:hypothetical protein
MVLIVCRISGCANQKELSNQDQEDNAKDAVAELYNGPARFRVISTIGKGEALDRPELVEIEEAYKSRKYDVVVYDDLSRLIRGSDAERLLRLGVDHGTRSICVQDGIDTADDTWQVPVQQLAGTTALPGRLGMMRAGGGRIRWGKPTGLQESRDKQRWTPFLRRSRPSGTRVVSTVRQKPGSRRLPFTRSALRSMPQGNLITATGQANLDGKRISLTLR